MANQEKGKKGCSRKRPSAYHNSRKTSKKEENKLRAELDQIATSEEQMEKEEAPNWQIWIRENMKGKKLEREVRRELQLLSEKLAQCNSRKAEAEKKLREQRSSKKRKPEDDSKVEDNVSKKIKAEVMIKEENTGS